MTNQPAAHDRRIVVGVDGSPGSKTALHWAIAQAERTGATVEAIGAWQDPVTGGSVIGWAPMVYTGDSIVALTGAGPLGYTLAVTYLAARLA